MRCFSWERACLYSSLRPKRLHCSQISGSWRCLLCPSQHFGTCGVVGSGSLLLDISFGYHSDCQDSFGIAAGSPHKRCSGSYRCCRLPWVSSSPDRVSLGLYLQVSLERFDSFFRSVHAIAGICMCEAVKLSLSWFNPQLQAR